MGVFTDLRTGADVGERTEKRTGLDCRICHHSVVSHTHTVTERGVHNPAAGVDFTRGANLRRPFQEHARVDHRIGSDNDVAVDVGGGRVNQRDTCGHQLFVLLLADHGTDLGKFCAAVDAANLFRALDRPGSDGVFLFAIDGDQVRQVVLALVVRRANRIEGAKQRRQVEGIDSRVDFRDLLLRRRGVALFDNLRDASVGPDDASVTEGPRHVRRHNRGRSLALSVRLDQRPQRVTGQQWDIA